MNSTRAVRMSSMAFSVIDGSSYGCDERADGRWVQVDLRVDLQRVQQARPGTGRLRRDDRVLDPPSAWAVVATPTGLRPRPATSTRAPVAAVDGMTEFVTSTKRLGLMTPTLSGGAPGEAALLLAWPLPAFGSILRTRPSLIEMLQHGMAP